jgi:hypothetical protein
MMYTRCQICVVEKNSVNDFLFHSKTLLCEKQKSKLSLLSLKFHIIFIVFNYTNNLKIVLGTHEYTQVYGNVLRDSIIDKYFKYGDIQ